MGKHFVSTAVEVSIKWEEELVDNDRSNFYVRLSPIATLKKTAVYDASGKQVMEDFLDEAKKELKGKYRNLKVK